MKLTVSKVAGQSSVFWIPEETEQQVKETWEQTSTKLVLPPGVRYVNSIRVGTLQLTTLKNDCWSMLRTVFACCGAGFPPDLKTFKRSSVGRVSIKGCLLLAFPRGTQDYFGIEAGRRVTLHVVHLGSGVLHFLTLVLSRFLKYEIRICFLIAWLPQSLGTSTPQSESVA